MIAPVLQADIKIGHHVQREFLGMTFNIDTIWATLIAGALVAAARASGARGRSPSDTEDHVPSKLQLIWETVRRQVNAQVEDNLGRVHPYVAPLAISLFFFILICNWLECSRRASTGRAPAPGADRRHQPHLRARAITMVSVWTFGIRTKGAKGYFSHFMEPVPVLLPFNILEELVKPITLALRLFGNIFAGGIMLALIGALTA